MLIESFSNACRSRLHNGNNSGRVVLQGRKTRGERGTIRQDAGHDEVAEKPRRSKRFRCRLCQAFVCQTRGTVVRVQSHVFQRATTTGAMCLSASYT